MLNNIKDGDNNDEIVKSVKICNNKLRSELKNFEFYLNDIFKLAYDNQFIQNQNEYIFKNDLRIH